MGSLVTVAVFNATGGSNRSGLPFFLNWYDDLTETGGGPDVALVSEVFRFARVLRHCGHLRVGSDSHGREDAGVVTRRRVRRWRQRRLTNGVDRPGTEKPLLWHDRWATRSVAGPLWDRTVGVASHSPAAIQDAGKLLDNPGARDWRDNGLPALEEMLRRDMRWNRPLIHGCDGNMRENVKEPANPAAMYRRLGMEYVTHEVMWCAWNPGRFELVDSEVLPTPPGSDGHPVLLVTLRRLPRRRRKEK